MAHDNQPSADERSTSDGRSSIDRRNFLRSIGAGGAVATLAGCTGGNLTGGGTTTLEWASIYNEEETREAMADALHEAGLPDNIEMNITPLPSGNQSIQSRYDQWVSSGQERPDLLTVDNGWAIPFIVRGQLVNLEEEGLLSSSQVNKINNKYFAASVNTIQHPDSGQLHGVPLYPEPPTIQYRKDLVKEAGYDPSDWQTNPMTWKRFSEVAADVKEQTGVKYGFITQGAADENMSCCAFPEYFHSFGGSYFGGLDNLFSGVGDRPITIDEQPVIDSLKMVRTLIHGPDADNTLEGYTKCAPQQTLSWSVLPTQQAFAAGDGAFNRQWMFGIPPAAENFGAENLGVMPMPYSIEEGAGEYDGIGGSSPALGGWHVALNPNSPRTDAAQEFFKAIMQDDFLIPQFAEEGVMPPNKELFNSQEIADVEPTGRYVDAIGYSLERAVPRPVTPVWPQESEQIAQQARQAHLKENSPSQAMSTLVDRLESIESG